MTESMIVFREVVRVPGDTIDSYRYTFEVDIVGAGAVFTIWENTKGAPPNFERAREKVLSLARAIGETSAPTVT